MKKAAPALTLSDLQAALFSISPTGRIFFHDERDRAWEHVNAKTAGLKRPAKHKLTELIQCELFERNQMYAIVERVMLSRDRAWRDWLVDPLVQIQQPDGPRPIHLHFNGEKPYVPRK
jgi:hypothetical protein